MGDEATPSFGDIEPQELQALMLAADVQLVDVRTDHEWEAGHIPAAAHLPLDLLSESPEKLDRDRPIVFYCRSGNRSGMATQAFAEAGYDVRRLSGGLLAWIETGLGVEPEGGYAAESGDAAAVLEARRRGAGDA